MRATASVGDAGVELDAEIEATDEAAAAKVARFLELLRENAGDRDVARLRELRVEPAGSAVHVTWVVPAAIVLAALAGEGQTAGEPAEEPAGDQAADPLVAPPGRDGSD